MLFRVYFHVHTHIVPGQLEFVARAWESRVRKTASGALLVGEMAGMLDNVSINRLNYLTALNQPQGSCRSTILAERKIVVPACTRDFALLTKMMLMAGTGNTNPDSEGLQGNLRNLRVVRHGFAPNRKKLLVHLVPSFFLNL